ncbi:MAG: hypothetical protein M0P69_18325 [Bacteroidales bacterium]|jgi:hypothetical protein|nr:hypothetical protein [Bacteroidales bacterium]MDD2571647.1 hypothetical protein [Bacteroidales bacterium]MDD3386238.1 hypothetical protein [Bacteroidales bacterium]MDD3812727.1 hypothetical protein [Bacteroidales bacterium]MDD3872561.1 hypothetical protein [Bacteroidales bacterium]
MTKQQTNQKFCEALKNLIVQLPVRKGYSLKHASQLARIDLYKYRQEGISPMTLSLKNYCDTFQIDPAWLIRLADEVAAEKMTEGRALEILLRWPQFKGRFETAARIAIDETLKELHV